MQNLGTFGGNESYSWEINDAGQVAGYAELQPGSHTSNAFRWNPTTEVIEKLTPPTLGGASSQGYAINEAGDVAGSSQLPGNGQTNAFLWNPVSGMINLGNLGGNYCQASGMNNNGQVVGVSTMLSGPTHGFIWDATDGLIKDLNSFLPNDTPWVLENGYDINDSGEITGFGRNDGEPRAFVMIPLDSVQLLLELGETIIDLGLHHGTTKSLIAKLGSAIKKLTDNNAENDTAAVNSLGAFINAVQAQSGKKIGENDADELIEIAQHIIECLIMG